MAQRCYLWCCCILCSPDYLLWVPHKGGGDLVNRVINVQRYGKGWRVEAVTPSGEHMVVFVCGSLHAAVEQAMQAEPQLE